MVRSDCSFRIRNDFRFSSIVLLICWIYSIILGVVLATTYTDISASLMCAIVDSRVSIVGFSVVLILPIVLSAVFIRLSLTWMIYTMSVLKGISYGFTTYIILISYFHAGWLVTLLLMFSVICSQISLFFLWIRHIDGNTRYLFKDTVICLLVTSMIGFVDYFAISPIVMDLFDRI